MNQSNAVPLAIVVVDESLAMAAVVGEPNASGTPSHLTTAERVATAVNSLLGQFAAGPACDVAVIGYRADAAGVADVGCRWGGALADRQWIGSVELAGVARRESRTRRMPLPGGGFKETVVEFSVWYEPVLGVKPAQVEAWRFCKQLLDKRVADASHPLAAVVILHVFAGMSADGSPQQSIAAITTMALPAGPPLILQCHMAPSAAAITSAFPSNANYLTSPAARDLFVRSSPLSQECIGTLRAAKVPVHAGARGSIHNAKAADLLRCGQVMRQCIAQAAALAPPSASKVAVDVASGIAPRHVPPMGPSHYLATSFSRIPGAHTYYPWMRPRYGKGLFVFLLDHSIGMERRFPGGERVCDQLALCTNAWLQNLVISCSRSEGWNDSLDVCVLGYRSDPRGEPLVETALAGPLAGREIVSIVEIANNPARMETITSIIPDDESGEMLPMERQMPVWIEPVSEGLSPLCSAIAKACEIVDRWIPEHRDSFPPIVVNFTSGFFSDGDPVPYANALKARATEDGHVLFFNCYLSATPADPVVFAGNAKQMPDECARQLFEMSSVLPESMVRVAHANGWDIEPNPRGIAVNADMVSLLQLIHMGHSAGPAFPAVSRLAIGSVALRGTEAASSDC